VQKSLAILIDPDQHQTSLSHQIISQTLLHGVDLFLVGGSLVSNGITQKCVADLKKFGAPNVILFPGNEIQLAPDADALLFMSLISGRNPDYLIGHHIQAADELENMDIEIIPTSYLLIDGGKKTSVEYVSQTTPIPNDQADIARKIALAGKLQGKKLTYLDCGSGAHQTVAIKMIQQVKSIGLPLIIGGGVRTIEKIHELHSAGANVVVIGNKIEENIDFLLDIANLQKEKNESN
jgi:putative glycerol-1-phosphate prenyltransferase